MSYTYRSRIRDGNVNCGSVTNSHNRIIHVNNVMANENPEIMTWLCPLDHGGRHQDVRTKRMDGVGKWVLETREFREWRSNEGGADKAVLFCYGAPGVGSIKLIYYYVNGDTTNTGIRPPTAVQSRGTPAQPAYPAVHMESTTRAACRKPPQ